MKYNQTLTYIVCTILILSNISIANAVSTTFNLEYDLNGNLIESKDFDYEYNSLDQLIKVKNKSGKVIEEYSYNHEGKRI